VNPVDLNGVIVVEIDDDLNEKMKKIILLI
jgi:predicted nucleotide-binding protein